MTTDSTADGHDAAEPPQDTETISHDKVAWERALYMLLFGFIGYFAFWVIVLIAIVQLVVTLVNKVPNEDLLTFGRNLTEYLKQITSYLGFASEEKPCPFSPFPKTGSDTGDGA